jgi:hypothetical protein
MCEMCYDSENNIGPDVCLVSVINIKIRHVGVQI